MENEELYTWSKNGMKMIINTGFKTFDKQTNCITRGNVIANTMSGWHIRGYNETECNGLHFKKGELQEKDLSVYSTCISKRQLDDLLSYVDTNRSFYIYDLHYLSKGKYNDKHIDFAFIIEQDNKYHYILTGDRGFSMREKYRLATDYVIKMLKQK